MTITYSTDRGWIIEEDGLMVTENTLEEAIKSYGQGQFERGTKSL